MMRVRSSLSAAACAVIAGMVMLGGNGLMQAQEGQPQLLLGGTSNAVGFGRVGVGVPSTPQVVMLQNGGTANLIITAISVQGLNPADFSVLSSTCGTVAPAGFCLVTLSFQPAANGSRSGRLTVANNAPGSPHMIPLVGTGIDPSLPQPGVGPTDPSVGFPITFTDGVSNLELCLGHETAPGDPLGSPLCLAPVPDPTQPPAVTDTVVNFDAEAFWWSAEASIASGGIDALLVLAQEAAFVTETPRPGDQWAFGRLRIRLRGDDVGADTWYRFTHPFGVDEHLAEPDRPGDPGEIFATSDVGCFSNPCDFTLAVPGNTRIARFLTCVNPAPPAGYVGNPSVLCTVTGSPTGNNRFKVEQITGPGGSVVAVIGETNLFAVSGKLRSPLPTSPTSVQVPNVMNQLRSAAEAAILSAGLTVGPITTQVSSAPADMVLAQSPVGGTTVPSGSPVGLTISLGTQVNGAPAAGNDALATTGPLTFGAAALLANDTDPDGNTLSISAVSASSTSGGSLVAAGVGSWTYTPASGFVGVDTFTYTVTDGQANAVGTVSVTVSAPPPVTVLVPSVVNQLRSAAEAAITGAGLTVGAITSQVSTAPLNTVLAQSPAAGTSATLGTAVALTVSLGPPVNRAPVAGNDALAATGPLTFTAASLLANDSDPDGNPISIGVMSAASTGGGTIAGAGAGSWTYTPAPGFTGADTFTYTITDGQLTAVGTVSVTVTSTPPPAPAGLVLALGFDEVSGNVAADTSGGARNGTIREATFVAGKYGNALSFDGVNDWVTVADSAALDLTNGLTLEAWVRPTALNGWDTLLLKERGAGDMAYGLYVHDGAPLAGGASVPAGYANIGGTHQSIKGTSAVAIGEWTHIATTYDGASQRLYINGVLVDSRVQTGNMTISGSPLRIGGNNAWAGEFFRGLIDEVRIYNRALSAAELQADMNAPIR